MKNIFSILIVLLFAQTIYSQDTLVENKIVTHSSFFDYSCEKINIIDVEGWTGDEKLFSLKNDSNKSILVDISQCLKGILEDGNFVNTTRKTKFNITDNDLDSFVIINTPFPDYFTGEEIPGMTIWVPHFKEKFNNLLDSTFQSYIKESVVISFETPTLIISFINSKNDTLKMTSEYPNSPFYIPWDIEYNGREFKSYDINIFECLKPIFKVVNWNYNSYDEKQHILYHFARVMYYHENH